MPFIDFVTVLVLPPVCFEYRWCAHDDCIYAAVSARKAESTLTCTESSDPSRVVSPLVRDPGKVLDRVPRGIMGIALMIGFVLQ